MEREENAEESWVSSRLGRSVALLLYYFAILVHSRLRWTNSHGRQRPIFGGARKSVDTPCRIQMHPPMMLSRYFQLNFRPFFAVLSRNHFNVDKRIALLVSSILKRIKKETIWVECK